MADDLADGVYFSLPMDIYVAQPRLGAHSLGNLLVSPATYWSSSHLNPAPRAVSAAVEATRIIGSAYHCARLEPEHFTARYIRNFGKEDMPEGSLFTGSDMGAELAKRDLPKSGSVAEQCARLIAAGFPGEKLWHAQVTAFDEIRGDRIALPAVTYAEIVTDGERLRQSPEVAALIEGGVAEVSILWTDERGIRCKCRPDKLKPDMWVDLKTFSNTNGKHLEQAIADAIRFNRYHVGAAHYRDGIAQVRAGLPIVGEASDAERDLIAKLQLAADFPACWYVFQEKGGVPNILGKLMRFEEAPMSTHVNNAGASPEAARRLERATERPALWWERARREIKKAKRTFRTYSEVYESGQPWLPFAPLGEISDLSFSAFWLDEEVGE